MHYPISFCCMLTDFPKESRNKVKLRDLVLNSITGCDWKDRGMLECRYRQAEGWTTQRVIIKCQWRRWRSARNRNQCLAIANSQCSSRLFIGLAGEMTTRNKNKCKAFFLFFLFFFPSSLPFPRYSGATCGLAFVFVYPSLIYMISLHRAGQLTWPALIIHIFIILLGLANLIAQFLLWKLPLLPWLSQVVLRYLATALSNTVRHENSSQCEDFEKSCKFKQIQNTSFRCFSGNVLLLWKHSFVRSGMVRIWVMQFSWFCWRCIKN